MLQLEKDKGDLIDENRGLKAQVEKMKCKNKYVVSDKNSNAVPCYTVYECECCKKMDWNSDALSKLTELSEELKSHNPIQDTMKNAILKLNNEVEDYFRGVLDKNGITESEWLENGNCEVHGTLQKFFYKGKNIFNVSFLELDLQPGATEGKYSVYYWEPEDVFNK